jgi:small conductance mechanosensitive channel
MTSLLLAPDGSLSPAPVASPVEITPTDPTSVASWWSWFVGLPLRIVLYVVVGLLVLGLLRVFITSVSNRLARGPAGLPGERELASVLSRANPVLVARRAQRAHTIGSVLRSTASLLVGSIVVFLVLDALGINLAPFIASAGIIGVAVGFGAQSLVKDFLTGMFMLAEDQYGVGDVIDAGPATGTVEAVGLRVTRIRALDGTLWFVPNGSMTRVGNLTQQWASALVELEVDYFADLDTVRELLLAAAHEVTQDPEVGGDIDGEPTVTAIEQLSTNGVTLRIQLRTSAARQWEVARRLRVAARAQLIAGGVPLAGQRALWDLHRAEQQTEPDRPDPEQP